VNSRVDAQRYRSSVRRNLLKGNLVAHFRAFYFLHINHIIVNKKVVNRPKDQIDVVDLEKNRKIRDEDS
jgi:hypothetical protein